MARVRDVELDEVPDGLKDVYRRYGADYGPFMNQVKVFAHRPPALHHLMGMLLETAAAPVVDKRYVEICVVTVSRLNACDYCVAHHAPRAVDHGLAAETVARILEPDCPGLDEVDRLVRDYAVAVTEQPGRIRDALFDRLRQHFDDAQIVELTLRTALCGFFNRVNEALQIETEEEALRAFATLHGQDLRT